MCNKQFVISAAISFSLVVTVGCGERELPVNAINTTSKVKTTTVYSDETDSTERVPGNVHPAADSTLEAKISGRIERFLVKEGDVVKASQLLVELDIHEAQAKLDQALANQKQSEQDLKRFAQLLPEGAVTRQEYDAAETKARIAKSVVLEATAMVGYAKIQAPYDGIITKKVAQEGDLAVPGKPLLMIEKQDLYRFESDIPETLSTGIRLGQTFRVELSGGEEPLLATVSEISPTTDSNSRTLHIKLDLPSSTMLRSGQFGYVSIPTKKHPEIRVPVGALVERGQIESVFVVRDGVATLRLVRSGKRDGTTVQILSGLQSGEVVVTDDPLQIADGAKVEVQQ